MARSTRSTRSTPAVVAQPVVATGNFPDLTTLVAAGAKQAGKELWKQQASTFCRHYSEATGLAIGIDCVKVGGAYHHAFKAWQDLQS